MSRKMLYSSYLIMILKELQTNHNCGPWLCNISKRIQIDNIENQAIADHHKRFMRYVKGLLAKETKLEMSRDSLFTRDDPNWKANALVEVLIARNYITREAFMSDEKHFAIRTAKISLMKDYIAYMKARKQ